MYMSGVDCKPPPADQLAMLDEWKKAKADYFVAGKASDGKVSVALIREVQRKGARYTFRSRRCFGENHGRGGSRHISGFRWSTTI